MNIDFPSESAIEDYVYRQMVDEGWCPITDQPFDGHVYRQLEIKGYGITDIVAATYRDGEIIIRVIELKNVDLCEKHVSQLCRYLAGVERVASRYVNRLKSLRDGGIRVGIQGILAGPFSPGGDTVYLLDRVKTVTAYSLSLSMECGFSSQRVGSGWYSKAEKRSAPQGMVRTIASLPAFHKWKVYDGGAA